MVTEFLSLIIKDGCSKNLLAIISSYNKLAYAKLKIKDVDLIVSHKLESDYIDKLTTALSDILKTTPKINIIVEVIKTNQIFKLLLYNTITTPIYIKST